MGAVSGVAQVGVAAAKDASTGGLRQAYANGSVRAFRLTSGTAPASVQAAADAAGRTAGPSSSSTLRSAMETARNLRNIIPPEGHASAGLHAPIRHP
jgi:hypothetical protein